MKFLVFLFLWAPQFLQAQPVVMLQQSRWHEQAYGSVKPNQIEYINNQIVINVQGSSSALIYKLQFPYRINAFDVDFAIKGEMVARDQNLKEPKFEEDSYLRIGLVVLGDKKLTWYEKMLAPKWVKELFNLVPEGAGLDKIYFYNIVRNSTLIGQSRVYPQSEYIIETAVAKANLGHQTLSYTLPEGLHTAALWISADGDQTKSKFKTTIKKIILK